MPSIEITAEQAQRLASGESITVAPESKRLIAINSNGTIYEIFDAVQSGSSWVGPFTIVRYSSGRIGTGDRFKLGGFPLATYQFIEVPC